MTEPENDSALRPRRRVGRFELFTEIASGGMATVHLGRVVGHSDFARVVAIKRLHPHFAKDPVFTRMFLDEARVVARIRHPNVLPTIDLIEGQGELFIVMEYVEGETFAALMREARRRKERVSVGIALRIMCGALHGLHAAHEATNERGELMNLVHRDVSPENIMVGTDGFARLLDFGIARALGMYSQTREGEVRGKLAYMTPEQILGDPVTARTDVFSASVVLWQALTGRQLFKGKHVGEYTHKILHKAIDPPSYVLPDLPKKLDPLVLRGLEREADKRWPSAQAMAEAIEEVGDLATQREVGVWVRRLAGEHLTLMARKVGAVENAPRNAPPRSLPPPDSEDAMDESTSGDAVEVIASSPPPGPSKAGTSAAPPGGLLPIGVPTNPAWRRASDGSLVPPPPPMAPLPVVVVNRPLPKVDQEPVAPPVAPPVASPVARPHAPPLAPSVSRPSKPPPPPKHRPRPPAPPLRLGPPSRPPPPLRKDEAKLAPAPGQEAKPAAAPKDETKPTTAPEHEASKPAPAPEQEAKPAAAPKDEAGSKKMAAKQAAASAALAAAKLAALAEAAATKRTAADDKASALETPLAVDKLAAVDKPPAVDKPAAVDKLRADEKRAAGEELPSSDEVAPSDTPAAAAPAKAAGEGTPPVPEPGAGEPGAEAKLPAVAVAETEARVAKEERGAKRADADAAEGEPAEDDLELVPPAAAKGRAPSKPLAPGDEREWGPPAPGWKRAIDDARGRIERMPPGQRRAAAVAGAVVLIAVGGAAAWGFGPSGADDASPASSATADAGSIDTSPVLGTAQADAASAATTTTPGAPTTSSSPETETAASSEPSATASEAPSVQATAQPAGTGSGKSKVTGKTKGKGKKGLYGRQ